VYIQPRLLIFQSQLEAKSSVSNDMSAGQAFDLVMPMARDSGIQKTLKPYAMPIQRWIASAAGGTSQRLNPGCAMIRSRSSKPVPGGMTAAFPTPAIVSLPSLLFYCACTLAVLFAPSHHFAH
jgi:hypothetical protein